MLKYIGGLLEKSTIHTNNFKLIRDLKVKKNERMHTIRKYN